MDGLLDESTGFCGVELHLAFEHSVEEGGCFLSFEHLGTCIEVCLSFGLASGVCFSGLCGEVDTSVVDFEGVWASAGTFEGAVHHALFFGSFGFEDGGSDISCGFFFGLEESPCGEDEVGCPGVG